MLSDKTDTEILKFLNIGVSNFEEESYKNKSAPNCDSLLGQIFMKLNSYDLAIEINNKDTQFKEYESSNKLKNLSNDFRFYKRNTLAILTEASQRSDFINPNLFFFTPRGNSQIIEEKIKVQSSILGMNRNFKSKRSTNKKSTAGQSIYTRFDCLKDNNLFQINNSFLQDVSTYSNSTLRKAGEFLKCVNERQEEIPKQTVNNSLGFYLMSDHSPIPKGNSDNIWNSLNYINKTESFEISSREVKLRTNFL